MRIPIPLCLALPLAVSAAPINEPRGPILDALFCKINNGIVRILEKDVAATKYCSSYLSIQTSTIKKTSTVTPASAYVTVPITVTGDATTVSETRTATSTSVVTEVAWTTATVRTTSTSMYPSPLACLTGAYDPAPTAVKRTVPINKPKGLPSNWAKAHVSKACECLKIPIPSTTTTIVVTLPTGTITRSATTTVTPTATGITTTTEVPVTTVTVSSTTTRTISSTVFLPTISGVATNGIYFRGYSHKFDGASAGVFNTDIFGSVTNYGVGWIKNLNFKSDPNLPGGDSLGPGEKVNVAGLIYKAEKLAIIMTGFFVAPYDGDFVFTVRREVQDQWTYVWVGDAAYSWADATATFKAKKEGSDPAGWTGGQTRVTMNKGQAVPMTYVWANGAGPGESRLEITDQAGNVVPHEGVFARGCNNVGFR